MGFAKRSGVLTFVDCSVDGGYPPNTPPPHHENFFQSTPIPLPHIVHAAAILLTTVELLAAATLPCTITLRSTIALRSIYHRTPLYHQTPPHRHNHHLQVLQCLCMNAKNLKSWLPLRGQSWPIILIHHLFTG